MHQRNHQPLVQSACCCCSAAKSCLTLCDPMDCSTPGFPVLHYLLEFAQMCPLSQWCHPAILFSVISFSSYPQSFLTSGSFLMSQLFTSDDQKYWSFSISPSNEYSGLIYFRIDWFVLLAVQGTLKSFLQHHNLKASILWHSAFFIVQLSHPYMTIGKTIALTRWTTYSFNVLLSQFLTNPLLHVRF